MKFFWPNMACSILLLSGCMYGSGIAPITALNQGSGQYLSPSSATGQWQVKRSTPQPQSNIQFQRYPGGQNSDGQTIALTPARVNSLPNNVPAAPVRPVRPNAAAQAVVNTSSPYGQPKPTQAYQPQNQTNNDGWAVAPQKSQAKPSRPEVAQQPEVVQQENNQQATTAANPVRPKGATEVSRRELPKESVTSNNEQTTSQRKEVASATPPQQPTKSAVGETAVSALLKKASASLGKGDLDGAAAYLENAQRIEPQNAKILYDIANIRYHQGRYKDAENFAGRAVQVGGGNSMMKKSWALVANARKSLGDNQGAIAAAEKAASY